MAEVIWSLILLRLLNLRGFFFLLLLLSGQIDFNADDLNLLLLSSLSAAAALIRLLLTSRCQSYSCLRDHGCCEAAGASRLFMP